MTTTKREDTPTVSLDLSPESRETTSAVIEVVELPVAIVASQEVQLASNEDSILMKLIKSKQLPGYIRTKEEAFTVAKMGKELGFPIMSSFHQIIPIQGKLTLTAKAQNGIMRRAGIKIECIEDAMYVYRDGSISEYPKQVVDPATDKPVDRRTVLRFTRDGISELVRYTWMDATEAGLSTKDNWVRMKRDMLYSRCLSRGATRIAADLTMGLYTTDEIHDSLENSDIRAVRGEDGTITSIITPHEIVA